MNLMQIVSQAAEIEKLLLENQGEVADPLMLLFDEIDKMLVEKVDAYELVMTRLTSSANQFRNHAQEFTSAARKLEEAVEKMKERIKMGMLVLQKTELQGSAYRFKLSKGVGRLVITDETKIPEAFKMIIQKQEVDKVRLKDELKLGKLVNGAKLEDSLTLRTYTTTK